MIILLRMVWIVLEIWSRFIVLVQRFKMRLLFGVGFCSSSVCSLKLKLELKHEISSINTSSGF